MIQEMFKIHLYHNDLWMAKLYGKKKELRILKSVMIFAKNIKSEKFILTEFLFNYQKLYKCVEWI